MHAIPRSYVATLLFLLSALFTASPAIAEEIVLEWVGCGITRTAFMAELAAAYQEKTGVVINISGGGATKGIRSVSDMSADIGGACRHKLEGNPKEAAANLRPVAWDALVAIVHKENPVDNISLLNLMDIYEGEITNWKDLGGPNAPIQLYIRKGKNSGVGRTFRELAFADLDKDFESPHVFKSSGPLEKAVVQEKNAIGVSGISSARKRDIKILSIEGQAPSYNNIRDGKYLLYRPLYLVVNPKSPNYREVNKFVDFAHSKEGREVIRNNGTVPYLDAVSLVRKQREQWTAARKRRQDRAQARLSASE